MVSNSSPISIYFHVPFCKKKCAYCHFYVIPDKDTFKEALMQGFLTEWQMRLPLIQDKEIVSVYFGGGTPSLLGAALIGEIVQWVRPYLTKNSPEITLEVNPEQVTPTLMEAFAQAGVNRVSLGIQSFDNALLQKLTREHDTIRAQEAVLQTAQAGIPNISIDLMYDIPGQTLQNWHDTLDKAAELPITHLSLYNLTIEPHTIYHKYRNAIEKQLPNEEESLRMYETAVEVLGAAKLQQYEISAFARNGLQSTHNVGYWTARPFLGFGPSAFSYWNGKRFRNVANLNRYCTALKKGAFPVDFEEDLAPINKRRELLAVQIRLVSGVNLMEFEGRHGGIDEETHGVLGKLHSEGFVSMDGGCYTLTRKGVLFYDTVAAELI